MATMRQLLEFPQVESFLNTHFPTGIRDLAPIGQGDWSQAFSFHQDGTALVARFGEYREDYMKDRYASRFARRDLPIPQVREIGQALGRYFCISERAYGAMLDGLDAEGMKKIVPSVLQLFDALRTADVGDASGFGGWNADGKAGSSSWRENLLGVDQEGERVHGWHAAMAESPTGIGAYQEALAYLKTHIRFCPEIRHLLHTDLLHFNVLVSDDQIRAVVDWGNAQYGDFLYELAGFTFYAPWYPAMNGIDWEAAMRRHYEEIGLDVPDFEVRLRCYEAHIGLDGMAYNAFTRNWKELADTAARTLERIGGSRG